MNPGTVSLEKFTKRRASASIAASSTLKVLIMLLPKTTCGGSCTGCGIAAVCTTTSQSRTTAYAAPASVRSACQYPRARPVRRVPGRNRQISGAHVMAGDLQARNEGPTDLAPRARDEDSHRTQRYVTASFTTAALPRRKSRSQPSFACRT